jgi:hypothetical protein
MARFSRSAGILLPFRWVGSAVGSGMSFKGVGNSHRAVEHALARSWWKVSMMQRRRHGLRQPFCLEREGRSRPGVAVQIR